jgi:CheY-like chemotaxis protein
MIIDKVVTRNAMIAEDNDQDFDFFSQAINKISVKVVVTRAEDGEILIRLLERIEINPDVLFLDLLLPMKDGRECLKIIRRNKKFDFMPIIIYSNPKEYDSVEFCYRESANLLVFKPTTTDELVIMLERIFAIEWSKMMYYPPLDNFVINPHYTLNTSIL